MSESSEQSDVMGFDSYQMKLGDLMRGERATLGKSLLDVQRDLRIKAAYIAAIENCDPSAFQTQGFIAGYVRSYARYLALDPDDVFAMFCAESNFNGVHANSKSKPKTQSPKPARLSSLPDVVAKQQILTVRPRRKTGDPIANPKAPFVPSGGGVMADVSVSALASMLVLVVLILGIGYGGWAVLQDIQRVEFAPVEPTEGIANSVNTAAVASNDGVLGNGQPPAILADRLYRPQELEVPVMTARDGPISTLNPDEIGALVSNSSSDGATTEEFTAPQVTKAEAAKTRVVAARPAWVRVSDSDGSVLFEKILDGGESFELPTGVVPELRAGNSGFVFVTIGDETFGPVGDGTSVAKRVSLAADDIRQTYKAINDSDQLEALENPRVITLNETIKVND